MIVRVANWVTTAPWPMLAMVHSSDDLVMWAGVRSALLLWREVKGYFLIDSQHWRSKRPISALTPLQCFSSLSRPAFNNFMFCVAVVYAEEKIDTCEKQTVFSSLAASDASSLSRSRSNCCWAMTISFCLTSSPCKPCPEPQNKVLTVFHTFWKTFVQTLGISSNMLPHLKNV